MSWERDPLWAKSKLFFERAFDESPDDSLYGLWCSMGLELLARAALASVSPTLLAEADRDHRYLLHALERGSKDVIRRSIKTAQVFNLCTVLFEGFSKEDYTASMALVNRRNDELHTGAAAFDEYPSSIWLPGFYRACQALTEPLKESLESLFGSDEAEAATEILEEAKKEVQKRVLDSIAQFKKLFDAKSAEERAAIATQAANETQRLVHRRHHKVTCPACGCDATVQGEPFGAKHVRHNDDGSITVRQSVSPRSFCCTACGLALQGYSELHVAKLGGQYSRRSDFTPEDYYGLVDPETADLSPYMQEYIDKYLEDYGADYDNE